MLKNIKQILAAIIAAACVILSATPVSAIETNSSTNTNQNIFELPIDGATGYAIAAANIRSENNSKSNKLGVIPAGGMFVIHEECGNYIKITYQNITGYAVKSLVMVNLPDVIPSIKYINSNAEASQFKSSGYDLNNITGEKLYTGKTWNERLNREEHNMPVLYNTAKKLMAVQQQALSENYCILLYEAYRPVKVQQLVNKELSNLMQTNKTVNRNINDGTWGKGWFIAKSLSNHQMGMAVDVSLGKVITTTELQIGNIILQIPDEIQECNMPTAMHELSNKAIALKYPVNSLSKTAWKNVPLAAAMTEDAKRLQKYFTCNDMHPLPSEWWHFNDLDARIELKNTAKCSGNFEITGNCSQKQNIGSD